MNVPLVPVTDAAPVPRLRLGPADWLVIKGMHHDVESNDSHGVVLWYRMAERRVRTHKTHAELFDHYWSGDLTIGRAKSESLPENVRANSERILDGFDPEARDEILMRLEYCLAVERYHARGIIVLRPEKGYAQVAKLVARYRRLRAIKVEGRRPDKVPFETFSGSTVRNWYNWFRKSGKTASALASNHDKKGGQPTAMDPEVLSIISDRMINNYLTMERPPLTTVHDLIAADVDVANRTRVAKLPVPSIDQIRSWKRTHVSKHEEIYYRMGSKEAFRRFGHVRRAPGAALPYEMIEIDHTSLDILVEDNDGDPASQDYRRKKTRRVYLTVAIDIATRMICGFHLSLEPPSWVSVAAAFRMAILRKDTSAFGCRTPNPTCGIPGVTKTDNGRELHGHAINAMAAQLGTEIRWTPRGKPHLKGKVERLIGTVNRDFLAFMSGRTFRDPRERGDYPSEKRARYTFKEVERAFWIWVHDIYHNRSHHGLWGRTPLQRWTDLSAAEVSLPPSAEDLYEVLALTINRTVRRDGVTFLGLRYQSAELQAMHRKSGHLGKKYMVKIDPHDLGAVLVFDEENSCWIHVPCEFPELADGVSLVEWRQVAALARKRTRRDTRVATETLRQARRQLAEEARRKGHKPIRMTREDVAMFTGPVVEAEFNLVGVSDGVPDELTEAKPDQAASWQADDFSTLSAGIHPSRDDGEEVQISAPAALSGRPIPKSPASVVAPPRLDAVPKVGAEPKVSTPMPGDEDDLPVITAEIMKEIT